MWDFAAHVCGGYCGGFDEQMTFLQILGLILLLMPLVGILILSFIADWRGTLFDLAIVGMIFLGVCLLGGAL